MTDSHHGPRDHDPLRRVTVTVPAWFASLTDPGVRAAIALVLGAVVGFVMLLVGWRGAARTLYVPLQLPWLASASIGGLAVLGTSLGAWSIHLSRRAEAAERATWEHLVHDAAALADAVRGSRR